MGDFAEMRRAIRELNDRTDCLAGMGCPDPGCLGTLRRHGDTVVCDECGGMEEEPFRLY